MSLNDRVLVFKFDLDKNKMLDSFIVVSYAQLQ